MGMPIAMLLHGDGIRPDGKYLYTDVNQAFNL